MECEKCSKEMNLVNFPKLLAQFVIPFTRIEVVIINNGAQDWVCEDCGVPE